MTSVPVSAGEGVVPVIQADRALYPHDTSWSVQRGETEIEVLVDYGVEERGSAPSGMFGPPENYDPGSGWVFRINPVAFVSETETVTLTEAEMEAVHDWLAENHEEGDGYDYDY